MARISRVIVPEYPHHVAERGVRSMAIFQTDEESRSCLNYLGEEAERLTVRNLSKGKPGRPFKNPN
jgi:putative transposase